jgi:Protein of unknown function (DUF3995)
MTLLILWFTTSVCSVLAFVTLLWSLGFVWPMRSEADLVRAVIGTKDRDQMPQAWPLALYPVLFMTAAIWPVWPSPWVSEGLAVLAAIFLARGVVTLTGLMAKICPEQPFATLDRRFYGPLSLALGLAFILLWSRT